MSKKVLLVSDSDSDTDHLLNSEQFKEYEIEGENDKEEKSDRRRLTCSVQLEHANVQMVFVLDNLPSIKYMRFKRTW